MAPRIMLLVMANAFPPWLCLSKHCYNIPHRWPVLGKLCSAKDCYTKNKKHLFLHMLALSCYAGIKCLFQSSIASPFSSNPFDNIYGFSKCRVQGHLSRYEFQKHNPEAVYVALLVHLKRVSVFCQEKENITGCLKNIVGHS